MSWKTSIQLRDLEGEQRLELICKICAHVHYRTVESILINRKRGYLYMDEVEARLHCNARGCRGAVRMIIERPKDTSAFVGGLA